jgi:hypothetical protein
MGNLKLAKVHWMSEEREQHLSKLEKEYGKVDCQYWLALAVITGVTAFLMLVL